MRSKHADITRHAVAAIVIVAGLVTMLSTLTMPTSSGAHVNFAHAVSAPSFEPVPAAGTIVVSTTEAT
jgi:hypothetical protein